MPKEPPPITFGHDPGVIWLFGIVAMRRSFLHWPSVQSNRMKARMKRSVLMASMAAAVLFSATGAPAAPPGPQPADPPAKIAESGKITLAYRESSVPFSYLDGANKPIGFSVELSNAVVEAVKKKLNKPNLQVALMPVTSQNRIPLLTNGTVDLECGSTTNNSARGKDVAF